MGILVNKNTRVIVQGITGGYAKDQVNMMVKYGTKIVAGVTPGKGGTTVEKIPVYDTVKGALEDHPADASIIYVGPRIAKEAALEAIDNGLKFLVIGTEGIPIHDTMFIRRQSRLNDVWVVGPNGLGITTPGETCLGTVMPYVRPGNVGVVSRSGSLMIQLLYFLNQAGIGQSTSVSAGGDFVLGRNPVEFLELFEKDQETRAVLFIGEIGGMKEYEIADYIKEMSKPVVAYIVGRTTVPGKRMGHIGAIVASGADSAESKRNSLKNAGALIADTPWQIIDLLNDVI